jgi:integral membrane protein (TIGR01906 family)
VLCPIILVFGAVSALTTDAFLAFEYGKSSFPSDGYGFTPQQRFILASTNVHYVRAHLPDNELSKQTLNGIPVFNEREVSHMADVQTVFQYVLRSWQLAFTLFAIIGFVFWMNGNWKDFASGVRMGGLITSALILTMGLLAVFAWETWFSLFHRFLFVPGSWLFSYSDTLIRLFPARFWFDATLTLSALSFVGGLLVAFAGWRWQLAASRYPRDILLAS